MGNNITYYPGNIIFPLLPQYHGHFPTATSLRHQISILLLWNTFICEQQLNKICNELGHDTYRVARRSAAAAGGPGSSCSCRRRTSVDVQTCASSPSNPSVSFSRLNSSNTRSASSADEHRRVTDNNTRIKIRKTRRDFVPVVGEHFAGTACLGWDWLAEKAAFQPLSFRSISQTIPEKV
ncbi:hypothetical protein AMELA_G00153100 [Ameiurus melas]|uniref:Uncharacterized protein n=1 Tax=Ameiurus melas TaxID=219545 RepID=A0A7J6AIV5_AMEME|nr:hypothetical protein AMELA_G00153100 [Ameiurus melas]